MAKFELKLKTPKTPNFILTDRDDVKVHISQLSIEQLTDIAEDWKHDLIAAHKKPYTAPPIMTSRETVGD